MKGLFLIALLVAGTTSWAQTAVVVPNDRATAGGGATFLGPVTNSARRYQLLIGASQLSGFVGKNMGGIAFRSGSALTSTWPSAPVVYSDYRILLGPSVPIPERSLTLGNNAAGTQFTARSGSLTFETNAFPLLGTSFQWGQIIPFDSPYMYSGGDLLLEIRHGGSTGTSRSVDAVGTSASTGYGTLFSAAWGSSSTATSGSQGNFAVTRFLSGLNVLGTVTLQDFEGSLDGRAITVTATPAGGTTPVYTVARSLSVPGWYSALLVNLPPGSYDLRVKTPGFLRRKVTRTLVETANTTGVNFTLLGGDVDNSGEIDLTDIDLIIGKYLEAGPLPEDVNGSGEVDLTDVDIAIGNYLESDE